MNQHDILLLLVDALNGDEGTAILVPDLRAQILDLHRSGEDIASLESLAPEELFQLLRQLVAEDLVDRDERGYVISEAGRERADELRAAIDGLADRIADAAQRALVRAA
jgi:hypothetical protein